MAGRSRERIARNFVERYGRDQLKDLLDRFAAGDSGQAIADAYGVSRERVRQWKNAFGSQVTMYQVHADVRAVAEHP
jgi:hypothetical protein